MTNEMLRTDDTKPVRLLVALEPSLSKWGLAAAVASVAQMQCNGIRDESEK